MNSCRSISNLKRVKEKKTAVLLGKKELKAKKKSEKKRKSRRQSSYLNLSLPNPMMGHLRKVMLDTSRPFSLHRKLLAVAARVGTNSLRSDDALTEDHRVNKTVKKGVRRLKRSRIYDFVDKIQKVFCILCRHFELVFLHFYLQAYGVSIGDVSASCLDLQT